MLFGTAKRLHSKNEKSAFDTLCEQLQVSWCAFGRLPKYERAFTEDVKMCCSMNQAVEKNKTITDESCS